MLLILLYFIVLTFIIYKILNIFVSFYELTKKYFLNIPVISVILTLLLFLYFGSEGKKEIGMITENYEHLFSFSNLNYFTNYVIYMYEKFKLNVNSLYNMDLNTFKSEEEL